MDIHFGRIRENQKGTKIVDINDNTQDEIGKIGIYEGPARKLYRKWDNIKHISEKITKRKCPRTKYGIGNWGLSIKTKERLTKKIDKEMPFGLVITLKEMYGENRIDDFIKFLKDNYHGKKVGIVAHRAPQLAFEVLTKNISWEEANRNDWRKAKAWQPGWEYIIK